jgi:hypothetical protein
MIYVSMFFLCVIHEEGLCPSSGDIKRLLMMKYKIKYVYLLILII